MAIEIKDTGKKTEVAKHDTGEIVERKVYVLTETSEATTLINTEILNAKAGLSSFPNKKINKKARWLEAAIYNPLG